MRDDWNDEEPDSNEFVSDDDGWYGDDDDESLTRPCPSCGADIFEDAQSCPSCGEWVVWGQSASGRPGWAENRPTWFFILGVIGILAVIVALLF